MIPVKTIKFVTYLFVFLVFFSSVGVISASVNKKPLSYPIRDALSASSCLANPGTVNIDGIIPEPSIQSAVAAASNGDYICVGAGNYPVNLNISGKYITIESSAGASFTTLSSASGGPVIVWQNVPYTGGLQAYLIGFTITGGNSNSSTSGQAGGLTLANGADVQVRNCDITGNSSSNYGGGVIVDNSSPVFANDEFSYNSSSQGGGAMLIVNYSYPTIFQTGFNYNSAAGGGAVWADSYSAPVFVEDNFSNNSALSTGGAIGERIGVSGVIQNNNFSNNSSAYGGAIDLEVDGMGPQILDNTFSYNSALTNQSEPGSGFGGAISAYNSTNAQISGNNFLGNVATQGGGAIVISESSNVSVSDNNFYQNYLSLAGQGEGGAIYVSSAQAYVSNNCFTQNKAGAGGAVVAEVGAAVNSSYNTMVSNAATYGADGYPGGIRVRQGASSFESYEDLIANSSGSAIEVDSNPIGSYYNDDLYSSSSGAILVELNGSSYTTVSSLPSAYFHSTISVAPNFITTPSAQIGSCQISNRSQVANAGVLPPNPSDLLPVYRFYSAINHTHFFTQSMPERDSVLDLQPVGGFRYEAIAWYAYTQPTTITINGVNYSTIPVARYREVANPGIHFFSVYPPEEALLSPSQWIEETPNAFYVFPPYTPGMLNVCRFDYIGTADHFYTASPSECAALQTIPSLTAVWKFEGMAFSVPNVPIS